MIGTCTGNRERPEVEALTGCFVTPLPVRQALLRLGLAAPVLEAMAGEIERRAYACV